jgi:oligopeptide/dipeptide ABC transporter ATP-binding protein
MLQGCELLPNDRDVDQTLLKVVDLQVWFPVGAGVFGRRTGWIRAVDGVSFSIPRGKTLGLVGESGSGKTTTARAISRLNEPRSGSILLDGQDLALLKGTDLRRQRHNFQMIFQDPYSSLDPRQSVSAIIAEPMKINGMGNAQVRADQVARLLQMVGLDPSFARRYPHAFSGGQRQRIGVARALASQPNLLICDEPVSALDVSIRAQIMNLLADLQRRLGMSYLFIAHDLSVVRHIADSVAVMYLGKIVELAPADMLYSRPLHPYTIALLSAVPIPDARAERARRRIILTGDIASPSDPPQGCRFHTRCWLRERLGNPKVCIEREPPLGSAPDSAEPEHLSACHFVEELRADDGRTLH